MANLEALTMGTKNNPGKFDCYEKAEPDEPVFVLLGRDATAMQTVLAWCILNKDRQPKEKLTEALLCAVQMGNFYAKWRDRE